MSAAAPSIAVGQTPPADTSVLWLSTSHKDMRLSQSSGDKKYILQPSVTWEGLALQEPSVFTYNGLWWMFYTGGNAGAQYQGLAYASNPQGPWTKVAGNPVLGNGAGGQSGTVFHTNVYIEAGTLYCYYPDPSNNGKWALATCPLTSLPAPTWTLVGDVFTVLSPITGVQGNSFVFKRGTGDYVFMYEANWLNYQMGVATGTSPSGPFTHQAIPIPTLRPTFYNNNLVSLAIQNGGPFLFRDPDGTYVLYYHAGPNGRPTAGYRAFSTDLVNWTIDLNGQPFLRRTTNQEIDQTSDLSVVQAPNGGQSWACFWSALENVPSFVGGIMYAPLLPVLKWFDGNQWVTALSTPDTSAPKPEFVSNFVATSNFTTTTVGSDVAITGLALTYTPQFMARAQIRMRIKVSSSAAGSVTAKVAVTPTTVVNSAPYIEYPTVTAQEDDMPADSTKFRTIWVHTTVDLTPGTTYTITGSVNNGAGSATTIVAFGGSVSEIELNAIPC